MHFQDLGRILHFLDKFLPFRLSRVYSGGREWQWSEMQAPFLLRQPPWTVFYLASPRLSSSGVT